MKTTKFDSWYKEFISSPQAANAAMAATIKTSLKNDIILSKKKGAAPAHGANVKLRWMNAEGHWVVLVFEG
jgi:hypothetical protein